MVKLLKGKKIIGENEVIFSFEPKLKNNSFRKWISFNFYDYEFSPPKAPKKNLKDNKKENKLTPSDFLKIHITVHKINSKENNDSEINTSNNISVSDIGDLSDIPKATLKSKFNEKEKDEHSDKENDKSDKDEISNLHSQENYTNSKETSKFRLLILFNKF